MLEMKNSIDFPEPKSLRLVVVVYSILLMVTISFVKGKVIWVSFFLRSSLFL